MVDHPAVAEAASVGKVSEAKGQAIIAFVTLREAVDPSSDLKEELQQHVASMIGTVARPDEIIFTDELPKTLSGKIVRRLLRDLAEGRTPGDTTALADLGALAAPKSGSG